MPLKFYTHHEHKLSKQGKIILHNIKSSDDFSEDGMYAEITFCVFRNILQLIILVVYMKSKLSETK